MPYKSHLSPPQTFPRFWAPKLGNDLVGIIDGDGRCRCSTWIASNSLHRIRNLARKERADFDDFFWVGKIFLEMDGLGWFMFFVLFPLIHGKTRWSSWEFFDAVCFFKYLIWKLWEDSWKWRVGSHKKYWKIHPIEHCNIESEPKTSMTSQVPCGNLCCSQLFLNRTPPPPNFTTDPSKESPKNPGAENLKVNHSWKTSGVYWMILLIRFWGWFFDHRKLRNIQPQLHRQESEDEIFTASHKGKKTQIPVWLTSFSGCWPSILWVTSSKIWIICVLAIYIILFARITDGGFSDWKRFQRLPRCWFPIVFQYSSHYCIWGFMIQFDETIFQFGRGKPIN